MAKVTKKVLEKLWIIDLKSGVFNLYPCQFKHFEELNFSITQLLDMVWLFFCLFAGIIFGLIIQSTIIKDYSGTSI